MTGELFYSYLNKLILILWCFFYYFIRESSENMRCWSLLPTFMNWPACFFLLTVSCFPRQLGRLFMGWTLGKKKKFPYLFLWGEKKRKDGTRSSNRLGTLASISTSFCPELGSFYLPVNKARSLVKMLIGVSQASLKTFQRFFVLCIISRTFLVIVFWMSLKNVSHQNPLLWLRLMLLCNFPLTHILGGHYHLI